MEHETAGVLQDDLQELFHVKLEHIVEYVDYDIDNHIFEYVNYDIDNHIELYTDLN